MSGSAESPGAREAGLYLAELLKRRPYRPLWDRPDYVTRHRDGELHHTAIAHVLAEHLHLHPREGRSDSSVQPSKLVPLISRALNGVSLSSELLGSFIEAFRISDEHPTRLWRLHGGTDTVRLLSDVSAVPLDTIAALPARRHTAHSVHDHHYLDARGIPCRHDTLQVIEATVDGLDRYAYAFDTDALTVEVLTGGTLGPQLYSVPNGVYAVDIIFDQPLPLGKRHTIKYETTFRYQSQQEPHFKRMVSVHVEYADVTVTFHRAKLPQLVWEAEWQTMSSEPTLGDIVPLDAYQTVTRSWRDIENKGYGVAWRW